MDDSELTSYKREGDRLTVELLAWNGVCLLFVFSDTILLLDRNCGDTAVCCVLQDESELLAQAISDVYESKVPDDHPYRHYQLLNMDDVPVLEVVSGGLEVSPVG